MVKNQCLLCQPDARPKSKWSSVIDEQVAKSLTRLLEEENDNFLGFFRDADYCEPCQEFVLEIDFLIHSLSSIQSKITEYRTKLSHLLLENGNLWKESEFQADECSEIDVKIFDVDINETVNAEPSLSLSPCPCLPSDSEADVSVVLCEPEPAATDANQLISDTLVKSDPIKVDKTPSSTEAVEVVPHFAEILTEIQPEPGPIPSSNVQSTDSQSKLLDTIIASSSEELVSVRRQTRSSVALRKHLISYKEIKSGSESEPESVSVAEPRNIGRDDDEDFVADVSEADDSDFEDVVHIREPNKCLEPGENKNTRNEASDTLSKAEMKSIKICNVARSKMVISIDHQGDESSIPKRGRRYQKNSPRPPLADGYDHHRVKRPRIDPGPDGRFECYRENCTRKYLKAHELRTHIFEKHPDRTVEEDEKLVPTRYRYNCKEPECSYFSRSIGHLKIHVQMKHLNDPRPFKCKTCSKSFTSRGARWSHHASAHEKNCVCDICGEAYGSRSKLQQHFKFKHNDVERFRCSICNKKLLFEDDLKSHEERHARLGTDKWTCVVLSCYLNFENQDLLKQHVVEHDTLKRFVCEVCGISCKRNVELKYHLLTHATDPLPFKCSDCEKGFKTNYHLKIHREIAHGAANGQVYLCKLCEKTFHCRAYLHKHTAWHKHGANANKPKAKQVRDSESE